jgi:hypothetical protein
MAWDFFIFLSRIAAAGGRSAMAVAKSDMEQLQGKRYLQSRRAGGGDFQTQQGI